MSSCIHVNYLPLNAEYEVAIVNVDDLDALILVNLKGGNLGFPVQKMLNRHQNTVIRYLEMVCWVSADIEIASRRCDRRGRIHGHVAITINAEGDRNKGRVIRD